MARSYILPLICVLTLPLMAISCGKDGEEMVRSISLSAAALHDYQGTYQRDKPNKAFAISPDGAYAVAHSYPSERLATATALIECNERVQAGQLECLVYDVNGIVVASSPLWLKRK